MKKKSPSLEEQCDRHFDEFIRLAKKLKVPAKIIRFKIKLAIQELNIE